MPYGLVSDGNDRAIRWILSAFAAHLVGAAAISPVRGEYNEQRLLLEVLGVLAELLKVRDFRQLSMRQLPVVSSEPDDSFLISISVRQWPVTFSLFAVI
jgi:hypothetical protein